MNIFYLDHDIEQSVKYHLDSHTNKIVTETAQCLSTALRESGGYMSPNVNWFPSTHKHHPIIKWLQESNGNIDWAVDYGLTLRAEYIHRYNKSDGLLREKKILETLANRPTPVISEERTPFKCAMPEHCKISDDPVINYREYYNKEKRHLFFKVDGTPRWTQREIPEWIKL
jgi:hypothetical protein